MEVLKYKVIKTKEQYYEYCRELEKLDDSLEADKFVDEAELLTLLIETYDAERETKSNYDPVELLHSLMSDHQLKARDLAAILNVSKGYVSDILHYKKGMSKEVIRKLAERFKMRQEAFNREYQLLHENSGERSKESTKRILQDV
ncbi:type II toxin-antitoxin system HigA family antitoxin [Dyadobacter sp. CY323]|uniref:helix-turn-helix domain-containing protein n=1 Tax=Dyadobacter sp. CY323 TaxID=2907302 RepID=UPI001F1C1DAA|nr:transcriptional regulator [Dyadobacter sp. CY323]MCE6990545.1 transcriptional regulator [Dyadobacter sp. CY323]